MAASRRRAWLRDELILALDLYWREGSNASRASVRDLSQVLRALPIEAELAENPGFRSPAAVAQKLANFLAVESAGAEGLPHGGRGDEATWEEFRDDRDGLTRAAEAIRANLSALAPHEASVAEPEVAEAREGAIVTRLHRARERSRSLGERKKRDVLARTGRLACEACGFDFEAAYGPRGSGFIECHHLIPVSALRPGQRTRLSELALICANCHRMIHCRAPWLSLEELRGLLQHPAPSHAS